MEELNQSSANDLGLLDLLKQADLVEGDSNGDKNKSEKIFEDQKQFLGDDDVVPSTFVNMKKAEDEKSNKFDENFDKENLTKAAGNRKRKSK